MSKTRPMLASVSPRQRARVSNRSRWLEGLDGRSREQRRFRDLCRALAADLGDDPSEAQLALIRATATATVASEIVQAKIIMGTATAVEIAELSRLGNLQTRNLIALGLRQQKRTGPTLREQLLAEKAGAT